MKWLDKFLQLLWCVQIPKVKPYRKYWMFQLPGRRRARRCGKIFAVTGALASNVVSHPIVENVRRYKWITFSKVRATGTFYLDNILLMDNILSIISQQLSFICVLFCLLCVSRCFLSYFLHVPFCQWITIAFWLIGNFKLDPFHYGRSIPYDVIYYSISCAAFQSSVSETTAESFQSKLSLLKVTRFIYTRQVLLCLYKLKIPVLSAHILNKSRPRR
jgi:hypothetical protein